jgi:hypothetical protein
MTSPTADLGGLSPENEAEHSEHGAQMALCLLVATSRQAENGHG